MSVDTDRDRHRPRSTGPPPGPRGDDQVGPARPRPDGDRLLGPPVVGLRPVARPDRDQRGVAQRQRAQPRPRLHGRRGLGRPGSDLSVDDARSILDDNGLDGADATIQERSSDSGDIIKVQVDDQPAEVRDPLQEAFAEAAGVEPDDVSVSSVSSRWGWEITKKAIWALVIFLGLIALFISIRFEWRMALSAILAMIHDVLIAVGIYSVFGFVVTPATVIAFLTILGYSLYDTIVVFDRIKENERRLAASGLVRGRRRERVGEPGAAALAQHQHRRRCSRCCRCSSSAPASSAR